MIRLSVSDDELCERVVEFLDRNPHLDLNIAPATYAFELPLHLGCKYTNGKTVERLLAAGADPELFCGFGRNALQCTADADLLDFDVMSWLTKDYKQRKERERYINSYDQSQDRRVTHYVAGSPNQRLEGVDALWNAGADWTLKDQKGNTPFEWAAENGHWIIASYIANLQWDIRDDELTTNANFPACRWTQINVQNVSGKSAYCESGTTY